ncbi:MAG TPA: FAD-binding oxidoreductase [candidate division Zixibacteria bacterium]|nr:FAD-binding oxidoreductase [candidate division Zixibacteria bacterium]
MHEQKSASNLKVALDDAAIEGLQGRFQGEIIRQSDSGYDAARSIWNAMIDKYPALIARCTSSDDVNEAVNFARETGMLLSVRGSGHNVAGSAVCDGGLMIDLSLMKDIQVDPDRSTAKAQPGVVFGEMDKATQPYGLAAPGGIVSETGIAGLTLGGGFGWLSRKHGFSCDSLISAEIVTAGGELLTASESENSDLFWGIRGGGGNFGIVTSFEFQLHPVGPEVLAGMMLYRLEDASSVLRFFREYTASAPEELGSATVFLVAPPAPFIPEELHGKPVLSIITSYIGGVEEAQRVMQPMRDFGSPIVDGIKIKLFTEHNSALDAGQPSGMHYYWKSEYVTEIADEVIDTLVEFAAKMTSPYSRLAVFHLGGAVKRHDEQAMAVSHRNVEYVIAINTGWADPQDNDKQIRWTRDLWTAIRPFSSGGVYVNFLSADDGEDRVRAAYGETKFERLVQLKSKYDPQNLFQVNKNVKPA